MIVRSKANEILNGIFQKSYYIGLSTTTPTPSGGNVTEPPSSSGYSRIQLSSISTANDALVQNTDVIYMGESLSDWGTITHFCVFTGKTGGSPIFYGELTSPVSVPTGYIPIFRAGAIKIGLDREV